MPLNNDELLVLKNELETDPKRLGYSPPPPNNQDEADSVLLNTRGLSGESGPTEPLAADLISRQVVPSEWNALSLAADSSGNRGISAAQYLRGLILSISPMIDPNDSYIVSQILAIWQPGTDTRAKLIAIGTREYSRAEALFGRGVKVDYMDVGSARNL